MTFERRILIDVKLKYSMTRIRGDDFISSRVVKYRKQIMLWNLNKFCKMISSQVARNTRVSSYQLLNTNKFYFDVIGHKIELFIRAYTF